MHNNTIFHKTTKGQQAIQTRDIKLALTMRCALIIVDGKTNVSDLHKKVPMYDNLNKILDTLVKQGLIVANAEAVNESIFEADEIAAKTPVQKNIVETITIKTPTSLQPLPVSATSIKASLISLIKDEFSLIKKANIQTVAEKLISELENTNDNFDALSMAWKKCIKITKLTIDIKMADC